MIRSDKTYTKLQRLRKKISPSMQRLLDRIKSGEKVSYRDLSYHELGTANALQNRCLITRDSFDEHYRLSLFTDELLAKYVQLEKDGVL